VIKVIDDQIESAFDLLADMLTAPRFEEKELENEQNVIIEEMKMVEDSPEEFLSEIFSEAFFPAHPLGMNIVGSPKSVRSFGHERTCLYHENVFTTPNLIIAAAGNVNHSQVEDLSEKYFGNSTLRSNGPQETVELPKMAAPILVRRNENLEQAHLVIAVPFIAAADERRYAADLLANIIGGGTSSRLWQKVREERALHTMSAQVQ
jgi:predicted Zn-dependent peptidase